MFACLRYLGGNLGGTKSFCLVVVIMSYQRKGEIWVTLKGLVTSAMWRGRECFSGLVLPEQKIQDRLVLGKAWL